MRCTRETKSHCVAVGASVSVTARRGKDATHDRGHGPDSRQSGPSFARQKPSKRWCVQPSADPSGGDDDNGLPARQTAVAVSPWPSGSEAALRAIEPWRRLDAGHTDARRLLRPPPLPAPPTRRAHPHALAAATAARGSAAPRARPDVLGQARERWREDSSARRPSGGRQPAAAGTAARLAAATAHKPAARRQRAPRPPAARRTASEQSTQQSTAAAGRRARARHANGITLRWWMRCTPAKRPS